MIDTVSNAPSVVDPGTAWSSEICADKPDGRCGAAGGLRRLGVGLPHHDPRVADDADAGRAGVADVGIRHLRSLERRSASGYGCVQRHGYRMFRYPLLRPLA